MILIMRLLLILWNHIKKIILLKFFFKYYAQYLFLILQPEFIVNMTAYAKMFLYAYTLEEKDPKKIYIA